MNNTKVVDIHKSLKDYDNLERAKIGMEFYVTNLKVHKFSREDEEMLARYFTKLLLNKEEYDQTS